MFLNFYRFFKLFEIHKKDGQIRWASVRMDKVSQYSLYFEMVNNL